MKLIPLLAYPIRNSSTPNGVVQDPKYATVIVVRYANKYGTENVRLLRDGKGLPDAAAVLQNSEHE